ncbi:hypothetical protein GOV14_06485 [Candidatus Pacearchaeota archaeon]|nr:hypothetical protein [Candidatus Pacearchaeota archaeon]
MADKNDNFEVDLIKQKLYINGKGMHLDEGLQDAQTNENVEGAYDKKVLILSYDTNNLEELADEAGNVHAFLKESGLDVACDDEDNHDYYVASYDPGEGNSLISITGPKEKMDAYIRR